MLKVDNFNELQEWSHDLLKRISVVLSEPNLSAELSEAAQELRDVIIQQASAKFLYEAAVSESTDVDICHVAEASLKMEQLIYEAKTLVSELELEARNR